MMWETALIVALVVLAIAYLVWRFYRLASGKTACQEGVCEGCVFSAECRGKQFEQCPPSGETRDEQSD